MNWSSSKQNFFSDKNFVFKNIYTINITLRIKLIEQSRYDCLKRCGMRWFPVYLYKYCSAAIFFNFYDADILLLSEKGVWTLYNNYVNRARATFVSQVRSHFYCPPTQAILESRTAKIALECERERKFESCEGQESLSGHLGVFLNMVCSINRN